MASRRLQTIIEGWRTLDKHDKIVMWIAYRVYSSKNPLVIQVRRFVRRSPVPTLVLLSLFLAAGIVTLAQQSWGWGLLTGFLLGVLVVEVRRYFR